MNIAILRSSPLAACRLPCINKMKSDTTHLQRTSKSTREAGTYACVVDSVEKISPTVKLLSLSTAAGKLSFKPGQWVDFFIPKSNLVGGYSICSAPDPSSFQLAVKYSRHPPALWIHEQCTHGDEVDVRVGGDVWLDPQNCSSRLVILVAGGIGINPLLSMLRAGAGSSTRFHLLYSASSVAELIFREEIEELCATHTNLSAHFHVTGAEEEEVHGCTVGRISPEHINRIVKEEGEDGTRCFVCGPPTMIDHFSENVLIKCEYEKWW